MKAIQKRILSMVLTCSMLFALMSVLSLPVQAVPGGSISVSGQDGTLTVGVAGSVTYTVTTANIATGSAISLNNTSGIAGITMEGTPTIDGVTDTEITISITAATPYGTHPLTLTIDGVTSSSFNLVVDSLIEVDLTGRSFSTVASVGAAPYYQVFKFTVPEGKGGYYTFYSEYIDGVTIDSYAYLCTGSQYQALCDRIETAQRQVDATRGTQCLDYNDDGGNRLNFYLNYDLEENETYYFIGTRYSTYAMGDYRLCFYRDIDIILDSQGAETTGTEVLYSKGNLWNDSSDREGNMVSEITLPQKAGSQFGGYYTGQNGTGIQVIDSEGLLLEAMEEIDVNSTIYAKWVGQKKVTTDDDDYTVQKPPILVPESQKAEIAALMNDLGDTTGVWKLDGNGWWYQRKDSSYPADSWLKVNGQWYMFDKDGYMKTGWTQAIDGKWFYFDDKNGNMTTGWKQMDDGKWYFLDAKLGEMKSGWLQTSDGKCYFMDLQNGDMKTGWIQTGNGKWYFMDLQNGDMKTGWIQTENGKWYFLNQDGSCVINATTQDGYRVDESGAWIE